jgi:penicillin-binding protein 1A
MEKVVQGKPVEVFPVPDGIIFIKVDPHTGIPATRSIEGAIFESFLEGTTVIGAVPVGSDETQEDLKKESKDASR